MRRRRIRRWTAPLVAAALAAGGLTMITAGPAAAATCTGSTTANVRGKSVALDQCVRSTVTRGSTTYTITVFYTETSSATNLAQCTTAENNVGRCEHALANNDDASGDNVNAKAVANEMAGALGFYLDRNLGFPAAGTTALTVAIGEDPRLGGINAPTQIYVDDEAVDQNDALAKRLLAYHEMMHLIQDRWDDQVGWQGWYGEGIARAIEDRVDTTLDADTGHLFIPELNGLMGTDSDRTATTTTTSYRSFLWWTWLFDQYRAAADTNPTIGWGAVRDFYTKLGATNDQLQAVRDFISSKGGTLNKDWLDYTASLWAYKLNPADKRLTYLDDEVRSAGNSLSGHTVITGGPAFANVKTSPTVNSHSVRYFEVNPASQCDYVSFRFDGHGATYGYTVMTANGSTLRDRWSVIGTTWQRTVRTSGLTRVAAAVTGLDQTGTVDVGWGCVTPTLTISRPTTSAYEIVGLPTAPRKFLVRLKVTGPGGESIAGLAPSAFSVTVPKIGGGTPMTATVLQGAYVQDSYWLLVQAPNAAAGAQVGQRHDLKVSLGSVSSTQPKALLYAAKATDAVLVLDRSGSMADSDKIVAARNAATLLTDELASGDQGGYVSFDSTATLDQGLAPMTSGHRTAMEGSIAAASPGSTTSIGAGMQRAATEHDAKRDPTHECGFVLLSDGYENTAPMWSTVRSSVVDNGCALHSIALGPEANETLLRQISTDGVSGSYDYADVGGVVPVGTSGTGPGAGSSPGSGGAGGAPGATSTLDWQNNVSRVYDTKAARLAGRQRLATFVGVGEEGCRTVDATVGFESQVPGSQVRVGDGFTDNRVPVKVDTYRQAGVVTFGDQGQAHGSGTEADLRDATLVFGFQRGCEVSFRYGLTSGTVNVIVNGEPHNTEYLPALDGQEIGGARARVYPDKETKGTTGTVVLTGPIDEFAIGGDSLTVDEVVHRVDGKGRTFTVDPTTSQLVTTVAWQQPTSSQNVTLVDPTGAAMPASMRRVGGSGTNEVWTVPNPKPGTWTVYVEGLDQPFFVTETAQTELSLRLLVGAPARSGTGVRVPLAAFYTGASGPVRGATVWATVTDPQRRSTLVKLVDDGSHDDGEPSDGIYGGAYSATGSGDLAASDVPGDIERSPEVGGSYTVEAVGVTGAHRREDSGAFAVTGDHDSDQDGLPDDYEKAQGLDPRDPKDARDDSDGDGLPRICEFRLGTDPTQDDTDHSGEVDGSEATYDGVACRATTDPATAGDDRVGFLPGVDADRQAVRGAPRVVVHWAKPIKGTLRSVSVQRRTTGGWSTVATGVTGAAWTDTAVTAGTTYQYRVLPLVVDAAGVTRAARGQVSNAVRALADPYAPYGSVIINKGAATTSSTSVTLQFSAEDVEGVEGDRTSGPVVHGTPTANLQLRVSNRPDFAGAVWQPYTTSRSWTLATTAAGATATVYVEFKDAAGNVSSREGVSTDSIRYQP